MQTYSVFVALVGRPNVGKSSLTNRLVGEKVAIVTSKPQTTRTRITGIVTKGATQYVLLDTPGVHIPRTKLGQRMSKAATDSVADVDVSLMLFEPYGDFTQAELAMIEALKGSPCIAIINKTDTLKAGVDLAIRKVQLENLGVFGQVLATSVHKNEGCEQLFAILQQYAQPEPHFFPADAYTDLPEKALVSEIVREKVLLHMRDEIPHGTAITVDSFKEREGKDLVDINITIYCEKKSHKGMIIGKGGAMLKKISTEARLECESFLGLRVNLQCWVKVKDDWRDSDFLLNDFGFRLQ